MPPGQLRALARRIPVVAIAGRRDPPLTTVGQPVRELGHRAAQRLRARIEDRDLPVHAEILPTRCVIRTSCGCPAPGAR